ADKVDAEQMRAGVDAHADLEAGIRTFLHVFFPLGVAGKSRLTIARVARGSGSPLCFTANGKPLHEGAVQADIELLRPAHAHDVVLILASQSHLDRVLAVDRKVVTNSRAAARPKREVFALAIFLQDVQRDFESLDRWAAGREPDSEPRDAA